MCFWNLQKKETVEYKADFRVNIQIKFFLKFFLKSFLSFSYFPFIRIFDHASNTLFLILSVFQDIFLVCQTSFLILQICKSNINIFILKISFGNQTLIYMSW